MKTSTHLYDRREIAFYLQELHECAKFAGQAPYDDLTPDDLESLVDEAAAFADELGSAYMPADREGCTLLADGRVVLPASFPSLWRSYGAYWRKQFGRQVPYEVLQVTMEMLVGANPAFMTYGGFNVPAMRLIAEKGTDEQKQVLLPCLRALEWDACFCVTEPQAGSDVSLINARSTTLGDNVHLLTGEKIFISAGMHELTANTVYVVLARSNARASGTFALTCLLVPKYWPLPDGTMIPNNVECIGIEEKMGLKGCANAHLVFGAAGQTRGMVLGGRENIGLLQLQSVMQEARMGTGLFALGMASSAYLHALAYARRRVQGRSFSRALDMRAPHLKIIEHPDVQRMLLEMKSLVEGSRGLIGRLTSNLTAASLATAQGDSETAENHRRLAMLYTPIVKAYVSDQAWRVAELSMQVHGGIGYLADLPIEQYARDIRILSIWEGTNYIQAQDLVRDKLSFGRKSRTLALFVDSYQCILKKGVDYPMLAIEFGACTASLVAIIATMSHVAELSAGDTPDVIGQYCTRILHMFGATIVASVLLQGACIAFDRLAAGALPEEEHNFYAGKVETARFFIRNMLPSVQRDSAIICGSDESFISMASTSYGFAQRAAKEGVPMSC